MKKIFITALAICMLILSACNSTNDNKNLNNNTSKISYNIIYKSFEEVLSHANEIVIGEYVGSKTYENSVILGEKITISCTDFEFIVKKKILGKEHEEKITVTAQDANYFISDINGEYSKEYEGNNLKFEKGEEYLLLLEKSYSPYSQKDSCIFLSDIIIPLKDSSKSTMWGDSLSIHANVIDFSKKISKNDIIDVITTKTKNNIVAKDYIRSNDITEIISESPVVVRIKVKELNFALTDSWYKCEIIEIIKGDENIVNKLDSIVFFSDTVKPGDKVIVAVEPIENGSTAYKFTSKNSLFTLNQYDEIMDIITAQEQEQEQVQD